jgi:two-component system, NarL family, invasion response regulator UvrY
MVNGPGRDPVTVLTVDDQETFLHAARELIAATDGFFQIGEADSGAQALRIAAETRPDLILLDIRMPDMDGLETARRLKEAAPDATVVLMSLEDLPESGVLAASGVGGSAHVRKQDLSITALKDLWRSYGRRPQRP